MQTYAQQLKAHLSLYKTIRLGIDEPGLFAYRGQELAYEHILPKDQQWLNILGPHRADIQTYVQERPHIKLHRAFHHLNSSQAFALNLFYPYFERGGTNALLSAIGLQGDVSLWEPEYVADATEGTSVDVMWQSSQGARTFCEVKLSEPEFGSALDNAAHRAKLERIYKPVLAGFCNAELLKPQCFFANYQLLRNTWLAAREPESAVVFLLPRANNRIWRQLQGFIQTLSPALASRVHAVAIEDVLSSLASTVSLPDALVGYAELLQEKYVPRAAA